MKMMVIENGGERFYRVALVFRGQGTLLHRGSEFNVSSC